MSRNARGTMSLFAGNPVSSGNTISSSLHNSTMSDIATEMTDSLNRSGKGAMLAPLELADGSVASPALSFDTDTDCGVYRIGANNLGIAVNGAKVVDVATTGATVTGALAATTTLSAAGKVSSTAADMEVISTKDYTYATAVTRYAIANPGSDIQASDLATATLSVASGVAKWEKNSTSAVNLWGSVKIPIGATITGVKVFATNTDGTNRDLACTIHIVATDLASTTDGFTETVMASAVAVTLVTGTQAWRDITLTGGPFTLGDEGRVTYRLTIPATTGATTVSVYALRFEYTQTKVKPAI